LNDMFFLKLQIRRKILLALMVVIASPIIAAGSDQIYFYDPDAGVNAKSLKTAMTDFLKQAGVDANFQPFLEYQVMAEQIQKTRPLLVLAPSVYFEELKAMSPVLIPEKDGTVTYKKAVVTLLELKSLTDLKDKTVASTSEKFLELLAKKAEIPLNQIRFILVKKDVDALLALQVSKQVDAAIVKSSGIEQFKKVNQEAAERLKTLFEFDVGQPIFWAFKGTETTPAVKKIVDALINMPKSAEGMAVLNLLKYDAWRPFTEEYRNQILK